MRKLLLFSLVFLLINTLYSCTWIKTENIQPGAPVKEIGKTPNVDSPNPNWLMWGHDCLHTSATTEKLGTFSSNPTWSFSESTPESHLQLFHASPIVYKDALFFSKLVKTYSTSLLCLKRSDGTKSWHYYLPFMAGIDSIYPSAIVVFSNKQYIFVSSGNLLVAIDLESHVMKWQKEFKISVPGSTLSSTSPRKITTPITVWEGIIAPDTTPTKYLFFSAGVMLYCLRAEDGQERWKCETSNAQSVPTISADTGSTNYAYVGTKTGVVYRLDVNTGRSTGTFQAEGPITSAPVIYKDRLFFGTEHTGDPLKGHFYCISRNSMTLLWKFNVDNNITTANYGSFLTSPCILENKGYVYVGCTDGWLYCFNYTIPVGAEVKPLWKIRLHYTWKSSSDEISPIYPVISGKTEGTKLVVSENYAKFKKLFILDPLTGKILWKIPDNTINGFNAPPLITGGSIIMADSAGVIYRYGP